MHNMASFNILSAFLLLILGIQATKAMACIEKERNTLLSFKAGLTDPFNFLSSWEGRDCCKWMGVVCSNTTSHVVKLKLGNLALSGEINPSLSLLRDLKRLDLSMNNFNGVSIPAHIGSLHKLKYLNLSNSCFNGSVPHQLGNLSNLRYLDLNAQLSFCRVMSTVDNMWWLTHLSSLKYLDMSNVNLGAVTNWLEVVNMLPSLEVLHLEFCFLSGIPTSLPYVNFTSMKVLDLSSNSVNSTLPTWLWNLTRITHLDLSNNNLHGLISDEFRYLTSLNVLSLGSNNFKGVSSGAFHNLCNLITLDLSENGFAGDISEWIDTLARCTTYKLQNLYLRQNNLKGNLSGWLEKMTSLTTVDLSYNSITGTIPLEVWKLPNITNLDLSCNSLEGAITEVQLNYLGGIKELYLSNNSITAQFSDDWVPSFQLEAFGLASCQLGPKFPTWLQGQTQLESLDLSNNQIVETLPSWLWTVSPSLNFVDLSNNQIKGNLPLSLDRTMIEYLNLSINQFEGPLPSLPPTIMTLDLSNNFFEGPLLATSIIPAFYILVLSNNGFNGTVPHSLCKSLDLMLLDLSRNNLSGELPQCLGRSQELFIVDASNNNLSGSIPDSICHLDSLLLLNLDNNSLSGEFPSSLQHCRQLVFLDLGRNKFSGAIPTWIGQNSLSSLMILSLHSNMFSGSIPPRVFQLGYLQVLDLSHNNLSGIIPQSIGNFSWTALQKGGKTEVVEELEQGTFIGFSASFLFVIKGAERLFSNILNLLESIDLSDNNLSGEIPDEIGDLWALQNLNLSRNHLSGNIPEKIGKMNSLESLDLRMNNLSGSIPQSLSALTFLNDLNLSYNNLSGPIPTGNQLQTLPGSSIYIGNPYLCGPPTSKNCSTNETIHDFNEGPTDTSDKSERLWLYVSVILGFITGFWAVLGAMLISKSFRYGYFTWIDTTYDRLYVAVALAPARLRSRCGKIEQSE